MALVTLKRDKEGTPRRLLLHCDYEDKDLAKEAGQGSALWNKEPKLWTYPLDPVVIRNLDDLFGDRLEVSPELEHFLGDKMARQQKVIRATQNTAEIGRPLWPFQRGSVRFLAEVKRGILGHQMGTGKTPIACVAMDYVMGRRNLVVCPNPAKWLWVDHLREWSSVENLYTLVSGSHSSTDPKTEIIKGPGGDREEQMAKLFTNEPEFTLVLNYDQVRIHQKIMCLYDFDVIICDEAHKLKSKDAQRTQAIEKTARRTEYLWLLTGTPMRNEYDDYYSMLALCDPLRFTGYYNFLNLHLDTVPGYWGGVDIIGLRDDEAFNSMLSTYMYRVTKKEVMPELPDIIYTTQRLPLNEKQKVAYKKMEQEFIMEIEKELEEGTSINGLLTAPNVISQLTRLRQICLTPAMVGGVSSSGKLDALEELIKDLVDGGERIILYTCFRRFLVFVHQVLNRIKVPYGSIVGGQKEEEQRKAVEGLRSGELPVITGTIQAMGESLNLQAASTAIFCDRDWVPSVNAQAEERIQRADTKKSPNVITLFHPDTVEVDILAVCRRKERKISKTTGQVETIRQMLLRKEG